MHIEKLEVNLGKSVEKSFQKTFSQFTLYCHYVSFALLLQGDFGTQKEAAWAISNLTISGRKDQVSSALIYFSKLVK